MKEIREADERWLRILFGEPYEAKFQSGGVHVYDGNGDEVLTYTVGRQIDGDANSELFFRHLSY